ncbi:hypothetical protein MLD38_029141 [Melastoma candidum]|uniref:Uncharacterized protein n=1 Tax=Melastoma candidum TaxID=119954 RepID=A0ACB9N324_9MYRT|nr:hypothetical protein MLD38_029141 [Melastoma candidum]
MPSWWGKSSSKDSKKKANKESHVDSLHRKLKNPLDVRLNSKSGVSRRHGDPALEKGPLSVAQSRLSSPPNPVSRCQSFAERGHAQPLPLPVSYPASVIRTDSGISVSKPRTERSTKLFLPLPRPSCIRVKANAADLEGDMVTASVSSECSMESDDVVDSQQRSPRTTESDHVSKTTTDSPSRLMVKDQKSIVSPVSLRESRKPANLALGNHVSSTSPRQRANAGQLPNLYLPYTGALCSAPDSSMSSPSRSPMRAFCAEQIANSAFWCGKHYTDVTLLGSGQCSSPGSGHNSGHNSMGGEISGQLFWQQSRGSPEYSPIPSPRTMASPGPSSRIHSGAVTPIHPRAGGSLNDPQPWIDDGKQQSHRLPIPRITVSTSSPFSHPNSAAASPSLPRSPGRSDTPLGSRCKKGKLLGRGTFGYVYVGFNSENGEMCAMKEVTLFSDDAKSKESAKQLIQEINLLSQLQHPNIVQYYGSETVDDTLYIYLEYVSGGSIHRLLQEYGQLGELAIRSYTQQILCGLAYLHAKNTVHRDIKGANILVDPNSRVKLADFGMAKHITGHSCPLSFKGSPHWMAPEVIKNESGCNLAVDIWSLGCTVLEMATTKPPWSQYEGVAAMFKIGNSKELPAIPDHLSEEGKDFVRQCLQRNPQKRPTATQLLEHPFVKFMASAEKPFSGPDSADLIPGNTRSLRSVGMGQLRNPAAFDAERLVTQSSRSLKASPHAFDLHMARNISCPVSPIGSPLLNSRLPPNFNGRMSPSPISSPRTPSGSCTPLTGGTGAIPFQINRPFVLNEGVGNQFKPSPSLYIGSLPYGDSNPETFRGLHVASHVLSEVISSDNTILGKQFGRLSPRDMRDGSSVLADRVSEQLLRDHLKSYPSLDLGPCPALPRRLNG